MFFDSHAHLSDAAFDGDRSDLIASLPASEICGVLCPSVSVADARRTLALVKDVEYLFAAVGVHPEAIDAMTQADLDALEELSRDPKCVAIGEIGLDYHYGAPEQRDAQRYRFYQQLALARDLDLPVIVHDRDAHKDCFDAIAKIGGRGVFHCFSSSAEMARELVKRDFYCSFTGVITYRDVKRAVRAVEELPLHRILIETDSPYLPPVPFVGQRNDPRTVFRVAETIAEIKGVPLEEVARVTAENACRLFGIDQNSLKS